MPAYRWLQWMARPSWCASTPAFRCQYLRAFEKFVIAGIAPPPFCEHICPPDQSACSPAFHASPSSGLNSPTKCGRTAAGSRKHFQTRPGSSQAGRVQLLSPFRGYVRLTGRSPRSVSSSGRIEPSSSISTSSTSARCWITSDYPGNSSCLQPGGGAAVVPLI